MGFSVSGSMVIVLFGLFIGLSAFYASGANAMESLTAAEHDRTERLRAVHDGGIEVTSVSLLSGVSCGVEINATNTGSTRMALNDTDLLEDNTYVTDWEDGAEVDGDPDTELWLQNETLSIERTGLSFPPDSVTIVAPSGLRDTKQTGGLIC